MILYFDPRPDRAAALGAVVGPQALAAGSLAELTELVAGDPSVQLVVLGPDVATAEALGFTQRQRLRRPSLGVLLVRDRVDVTVLGEAIRAGVREVVQSADADGIRAGCARLLELSRQIAGGSVTPAPAREGKVATVFAGKGGCGKSTMATNLAVAVAAGGANRVCLIDLDLSFGDVAIMLQLEPRRSLLDAVSMAGRLDEAAVRSLLTPYRLGVDTLLAPPGPAEGERVGRDLVTELITVARRMFDYVVIDTPPFFSDQVLAALDLSDHYVVLATPDIPALKNLRLTLDMFDLLEYPSERRSVVLNRADARVGLTQSDIERVVRAPIECHIPSTRDIPVSINHGVPIVADNPNHPVSRAIRDLAEKYLLANTAVAGADAAPGTAPVVAPDAGSRHRRLFSSRKGR